MRTISAFERCSLGALLLALVAAFALVATGCKTIYLETVTPPGQVAPESAPPADGNRVPPPRSSREILAPSELKSPSAADSGRSTAYAESPLQRRPRGAMSQRLFAGSEPGFFPSAALETVVRDFQTA
ncbi:MAG TPA: hypothetical protein VM492_14670 [Sumerlaeia bacterium]|nr:hypothetical protein [Sumerlaeia bacterium]